MTTPAPDRRTERIAKLGPIELHGVRRPPDAAIEEARRAIIDALDRSWIGALVRWLGRKLA
jgi:hypothetical protein